VKSIDKLIKKTIRTSAILSTAGIMALSVANGAKASVTDDLIKILEAKGLVSGAEAGALRAKSAQEQKEREAAIRRQVQQEKSSGASTAEVRKVATEAARAEVQASIDNKLSKFTESAIDSAKFVRALDNGGVGFQAGDVKFQIGGNINTFSTFESVDSTGAIVGGGLVGVGNDNFSIRNGLLPNALTFDISTVQKEFDVALRVGLYPGTNNLTPGVLNANSGGNNFALGTAGIDLRQAYLKIGREDLGTFKAGRDIGLFGRNAIFNDFGIFGVGSTGGNAAPANTSLGRIGIGYIYPDFLPQITYTTPSFNGFTFEGGIFQAFDASDASGGLSATAARSEAPQFQGQIQYDGTFNDVTTRLWFGATTLAYDANNAVLGGVGIPEDRRGFAIEAGAKFDVGKFGFVASGYYGDGVGTTAFGFNSLSLAGDTRESYGGYVQGTYKATDDLTFALSYGASVLDTAPGEVNPNLVEVNQSIIGSARYSFTKWVNFQGEVAYTEAENQAGGSNDSLAFTLGTILFF